MRHFFSTTKFPLKISVPVKITAIYFAVGILWILFSDATLGWVVHDSSLMTKLAIVKGCFYVSVTALMLYLLVWRGTAELESRVKERTKELSEANEALQAANKELESFSYSVSHDLRAPLLTIDGFSRMVLKGYVDKLDDEGRRKLNVICSSTKQMGQLIDDLLAFSRLSRKEMVNANVDMDALVRSAWKELTLLSPERRIQLSIKRLPDAMGDQALIKEVVVNLLSNAIKFTKFRETAMVEVGAYPEEERNVYFVKDNGVGFDMQYHDKLFGVFQRLHNADEFEGTGVGLAIVQRIIRRHGGRVWADGKVGEGATFYFSLSRKE